MRQLIVLDSGVLSLLTHSQSGQDALQCRAWMLQHTRRGNTVYIPEIADYEVRRKYIHRNNQRGIAILDRYVQQAHY